MRSVGLWSFGIACMLAVSMSAPTAAREGDVDATPSRIRCRARGPNAVEVRWSGDGVPAARFEIERLRAGTDDSVVVARAESGARSARVDGLLPGSRTQLRVVSVLPDGRRLRAGAIVAATAPARPARVRARPREGARVLLTWRTTGNADDVTYEVRRRIGDGAAHTLIGSQWATGRTDSFGDGLPALNTSVRYRVRAVVTGTNERSRWAAAPRMLVRPSIRVRQMAGDVRRTDDRFPHVRILVDGVISEIGSPWPGAVINPRRDRVCVVVGDAPRAVRVPVPRREWRRKRNGEWVATFFDIRNPADPATAEARGQFSRRYWSMSIHPRSGHFRIVAFVDGDRWFRPGARQVLVGMSIGDRSGGEIRKWRLAPGDAPSLRLR